MPKPNQYRVRFGVRTGAYCGLHFKDGISKETVVGPQDWKFVRLRGVWGASKVQLVPVDTIEGAAAPAAASAAGAAAPSSSPAPKPKNGETKAKPKETPAPKPKNGRK
jgi:hypothetical protein